MPLLQEAKSSDSLVEEFDNSAAKKRGAPVDSPPRWRLWATVALVIGSLAVLGYVVTSAVSQYRNDPKRLGRFTIVKDLESGEVINQFPIDSGEGFPAINPKTGKRTLYPTEPCYWTKDGKAKLEPTYVILGSWFGQATPTKCPDCGRVVTKFNKMPPDALMQQAWDAAESAKKR